MRSPTFYVFIYFNLSFLRSFYSQFALPPASYISNILDCWRCFHRICSLSWPSTIFVKMTLFIKVILFILRLRSLLSFPLPQFLIRVSLWLLLSLIAQIARRRFRYIYCMLYQTFSCSDGYYLAAFINECVQFNRQFVLSHPKELNHKACLFKLKVRTLHS